MLVQQFFIGYLVTQRALSPRTITSYRDAMLLFLDFARKRVGKMPTALSLADIEPDLILAFLGHLEQQRHISVRCRNLGAAEAHFGTLPQPEADGVTCVTEICGTARCILFLRH